MTDEFWDVVGSEVEEDPAVWRCRRFLEDCFTDDTETVPVHDFVCGHAVTSETGNHVKDQCSQCERYRVACSCGKGMVGYCMLRKDICPHAGR